MDNDLNYFRLYSGIRFNRPIEEKDFVSPGGYEFVFGNNPDGKPLVLAFDFEDMEWGVDWNDECMINCMQKNPDYTAFPEMSQLSTANLQAVEDIQDFYVYSDTEDGTEPLWPVELVYASFTDDTGCNYDISQSVIKDVFQGM